MISSFHVLMKSYMGNYSILCRLLAVFWSQINLAQVEAEYAYQHPLA